MKTNYYKVAGHVFGVSGEAEVFELMTNYEPFEIQGDGSFVTLTSLDVTKEPSPCYTEELRQEEEGQTILCGKTADGEPVFEYRWWEETAGWLVCAAD